MEQYKVITACYGGRRGTTIAALTQAFVDGMSHDGIDIRVLGRGNDKFIGNKEGVPVSDEHIAVLVEIAKAYEAQTTAVRTAVAKLKETGRRVATADELNHAHAVYAVDDFILGKYAGMNGVEASKTPEKYKTVLQATGLEHRVYGHNMDDTETTVDFTNRVIKPKIAGKTPENLKPADSRYFALDGTEYRAGDASARLHEANDLVLVSYKLAMRIVSDAKQGTSPAETALPAETSTEQQ